MSNLSIKEFLIKHKIEYKNFDLYQRAITHTTFSNEHKNYESYEMLELLGDSIIQAKSTIIKISKLSDDKVYIVESGLNVGDVIIAKGAGLVREGSAVSQ